MKFKLEEGMNTQLSETLIYSAQCCDPNRFNQW